jgi:uncharacterized integral membrane protein (TIGR00697 family)
MKKVSVSFLLLGILFCVCLVVSNFFETKLVQVGSLTLTAGLLVFPVSYIINDCISEVWGFRKARFIIWVGFAVNFFVLLLGALAVSLPSPDYWEGGESFNFVFGLAPRITLASMVAFLTGSLLNAYVMSRMKIASSGRHFSLRAIVSTVAGECADSLVFFPIAFGGLMPLRELLTMMALQAVIKTMYEVVVLPLTTLVVKSIKKHEDTDVYDEGVSYKFWRIFDI